MPYTGDTNSQYDHWPEYPHVDRMITPFGVPSPCLEGKVSEQQIFDALMSMPGGGGRRGGSVQMAVPPGTTGRALVAHLMRGACSTAYGADMSHAPDAELLDAIRGCWERRGDRYSELRNAGVRDSKKIEMFFIGG